MPQPEVTAIDAAGDPVDLNAQPEQDGILALYDVYGNESLIPGTRGPNVGQVIFDVSQATGDRNTTEVHTFTSMVTFGQRTSAGQLVLSLTLPGPRVIWYHPGALWANPHEVMAMSGTGSLADAVASIVDAMQAVRAWATRPVTSPVPVAVRGAVATLAARALTSSGFGDETAIVSERIGDYQVRYADPESSGLFTISGEIADSLRFLRPRAYGSDVGPKPLRSLDDHPYPVTATDWVPLSLDDELRAYIESLIAASGGVGGGIGGPQLPPVGSVPADQIIWDGDPATSYAPDGSGAVPPPKLLLELKAAPVGSMYADVTQIDPNDPSKGNVLLVWRKTGP